MRSGEVIIDGNNLLYAVQALAPVPAVGRETMVRVIERWAAGQDARVTLVFDGPAPRDRLARQLSSATVSVRFAAPRTADDVIVDMVHAAADPGRVRVISTDTAIRHEAAYRRCRVTRSETFVAELFPRRSPDPDRPESTRQRDQASNPKPSDEKPEIDSPADIDQWVERMGLDDTDLGADLDAF